MGARRAFGAAFLLGAVCVAQLLLSGCGSGGAGQGSALRSPEASPGTSRHQSKRFVQVRHVADARGFSFSYEVPDFMNMHEGSHGISVDELGHLVMDESSDQRMAVTVLANSEDDPSCILMLLVPDPTPQWYRAAWRGMTKAEVLYRLPAAARELRTAFTELSGFDASKAQVSTGLVDGIPSVTFRIDAPAKDPGIGSRVWLRYLLTRKRYYVVFWAEDERATYRDAVKLAEIARSVKVTW